MKRIFVCLLLSTCFSYCFSQDNPYEVFGYKANVSYSDSKQDLYIVKNSDTSSKIKFLEFDLEYHLAKLLDGRDSVIKSIVISDDRPLRFISIDPITKKYPELTPYQFAANTSISGVDRDGEEPKIVVTNQSTGYTQIHLYGAANVEETVVKTYKAIVQYTDSKGLTTTLGTFNVTRDGWFNMGTDKNGNNIFYNRSSDQKDNKPLSIIGSRAQEYGQGTPSYTISQIFSPIPKQYNQGYFTQGVAFTNTDFNTQVKRPNGLSTGAEFHVGGLFINLKGDLKLAGTYGCFGIVDPSQISQYNYYKVDPSLVVPSNAETQKFGLAIDAAQNMQVTEHGETAPVQVELQKRTYEKVKVTAPGQGP